MWCAHGALGLRSLYIISSTKDSLLGFLTSNCDVTCPRSSLLYSNFNIGSVVAKCAAKVPLSHLSLEVEGSSDRLIARSFGFSGPSYNFQKPFPTPRQRTGSTNCTRLSGWKTTCPYTQPNTNPPRWSVYGSVESRLNDPNTLIAARAMTVWWTGSFTGTIPMR